MTRALAVKCRMVNPSAQFFIVAQSSSYFQAKESGVGVHETWCDAPISTMPVDQNQLFLAHLPGSLHKFREDAIPNDFPRVIAVKIDLHVERQHNPKTVVRRYFANRE